MYLHDQEDQRDPLSAAARTFHVHKIRPTDGKTLFEHG
jgi:hypothetical protein